LEQILFSYGCWNLGGVLWVSAEYRLLHVLDLMYLDGIINSMAFSLDLMSVDTAEGKSSSLQIFSDPSQNIPVDLGGIARITA
jgi:hypothetical protein